MVDVIPQRKRQVFGNELKVISFVNFFFKKLLYIKKKKKKLSSLVRLFSLKNIRLKYRNSITDG